MIPFSYSWRSLWVRRATTLAASLGLALVTFVLAAALMLAHGVRETLVTGGSRDVAVVLQKGTDAAEIGSIEEASAQLLKDMPGVTPGEPKISIETGSVISVPVANGMGRSNLVVRGVDKAALSFRPGLHIVEGKMPAEGTDEAMIGARLSGRFQGIALGSTVELLRNRPVHIVGVFEAGGSSAESELWGDQSYIRAAFGRGTMASSVRVRLASADSFDSFRNAVEHDKRFTLDTMRENEMFEKESLGLALMLQTLGGVIALFFSLAAMIGATITMHAAVANRAREIGTLRALGFSRGNILVAFLGEAAAMATAGGLIGVGCSLALSSMKVSMMNFATFSELVFSFTPTLPIIAVALACSVAMGLVGGFLPAVRAARIPLLAALRG